MAGNLQSSSDFSKKKAKSVSCIDNSKKGSVDAAICDLLNFINASEDFFTTSSCSGRIALISEVRKHFLQQTSMQEYPMVGYLTKEMTGVQEKSLYTLNPAA